MQQQLRCKNCSKLLGAGIVITLEIKCPRCKHINQLSANEHPTSERQRAPNIKKGAHYDNRLTTR